MFNNKEHEFDWLDSFEICIQLKNSYINKQNSKLEAMSRLIISRAYYSAFRKLTQHLRNQNIYLYDKKNPTKSSHKDVVSILNEITDITKNYNKSYIDDKVTRKRYRKISKILPRLKNRRQIADYDDDILLNPITIVEDSLSDAKEIINRINLIENNMPYDHIVEGYNA